MKKSIAINDFVVTKESINGICKDSVGLINAIDKNTAKVLFVGKNKVIKADVSKFNFLHIEKTGDSYLFKICNICHVLKKTEKFAINQGNKKIKILRRPTCKECRKPIDCLNLTRSEKEKMKKTQPLKKSIFVCPLCKKTSIVGITAKLVRDHDHKTGKGRDWICDSCNTGLGRFKDDIQFFERIIKYLKGFEEEQPETANLG